MNDQPLPALTTALVADFVAATSAMPEARAARLAGVSIPTYKRWSRQPPRILRPPVRERITLFLSSGFRVYDAA